MSPVLQAADAPDVHAAVAPNVIAAAVERAQPCVIKLYGAGIAFEHGYGVGVMTSADGQAVTVSSLLLDATNLRVVLPDGREVGATVQRRDESRHLALLKLDATGLPHLTPATSADLLPGDTVIALGNSYKIADGDEPASVIAGVLSLRAPLDARRRKQPFSYRGDVLLFDAVSSNPGMAGGPLLDADGRWVGLIGKIVVSEQTNTLVSYALPIEEVTAFLRGEPALRSGSEPAASRKADTGTGDRAAPGGAVVDSGIRLFDLGGRGSAAYIDRVLPDSPAAKAGLKSDDLILAIDGRQIKTASDFRRRMARQSAGRRVALTIRRGEQVLSVELALEGAQ